MTISSRTPEGLPSVCPLCGASTQIEFSDPAGDAPCPSCGYLLWSSAQLVQSVTKRCEEILYRSLGTNTADTRFMDLGANSLDVAELVMELEEEFEINLPEEAVGNLQTIGDVVRCIVNYRRGV